MDPGIHEHTYWLNIFENKYFFFAVKMFILWKIRTKIRDLDMKKCNVQLVTVVCFIAFFLIIFIFYLIIIILCAFKIHNS